MKYIGSKAKIANEIVPILQSYIRRRRVYIAIYDENKTHITNVDKHGIRTPDIFV